MKNAVFSSFLGALLLSSGLANAQDKPALEEINFLVSGVPVNTTGNGDVTVELKFDRTMNTLIDPVVKFGLEEPFELNVPKGQGWISGTLWQGFFTISANNPETGDGEYIFQISEARDQGAVEMDTTLSSGLDETLFICRSGELDLSTTSVKFDTITTGTQKILNVTVFNESCATLSVSNVTMPFPFTLVSSSSFFDIAGNGNRSLAIAFSPNSRGTFTGNLTITSNDRQQSTHTVALTGVARGPKIEVTSVGSPIALSTLNFGKLEVGSNLSKDIKITNEKAGVEALSDTLHISSIFTNDAVYTVTPTSFELAPDSSKIVQVTFSPTNSQFYNGRILTIDSDDLTLPQGLRSVVLNGDASDEAPPPPLTSITVNWSGYNGYINGLYLPICWANPIDNSGIGAIWWYFSRIPLNPLTAPEPDTLKTTASVGGRIVLTPNGFCASLPLFGRITSGFWYCYVWLEDGLGNRSWRNALPGTFVYDATAPGAPIILSRSITPVTRWFGFANPFNLTIEIPIDATRNRRDASEARWKYQTPPTSNSDYNGRYIFQANDPANKIFNVPFTSDALCGDDSLYIWLADSAGNVDYTKNTIARYRFDVCPPEIVRTRDDLDNIANLGEVFLDTLEIIDDVSIKTAEVHYRFGGAASDEPTRKLNRISSTDNFILDIPLAGVTRRGIEYRVVAIDSLGNEGRGPIETSYCGEFDDEFDEEEFWFPVRTRVEGNGDFRIDTDGRPVPLIAGGDSTNYQLISVPYDLDSSDVEKVLADDLGAYDDRQWRLFDLSEFDAASGEATYLEGEDARPFVPGRSYFLITRKEDIVVDSGAGQTRRTVCNDTLEVLPGWNLIATPFNFPVHRESMFLLGSEFEQEISLRSFERGWNIVDVMEPWKGYALYVTPSEEESGEDPIELVIRPKAAQGRLSKPVSDYLALQPGEWLVQISGSAGQSLDFENWAGLRNEALESFDKFELAEPPVIGRFLRVQFAKPEWNQPARGFSTDIRPAGSDEQVWEFDVQTNQPETAVKLEFSFLGDFPASSEVFLVDEGLKMAQNLRANSAYTFKSGKQGSQKKLKLIVGSAQFASAAAGDIPLVPVQFDLLQNFPNPFNPETSIRYNLPAASQVKLEIFDVLGRKVRTLVNGEQKNAGYHSTLWNGRDDSGRQVASGVYIYRIVSDQQSLSRKMILMK